MKKLIVGVLLLSFSVTYAQESLLDELESNMPETTTETYATFKGTRIVNAHSIETKGGGELEFIISHRFGRVNSGSYNFWGLDEAFIRIGLEYGITDNLDVGIGRNSYNKLIDGYLKYKLLKQTEGASSFPITMTLFSGMGIQTVPRVEDDPTYDFADRINYTHQLLIARKFSNEFSLQVSPTYVHVNRSDIEIQPNDQFALGIGGRFKLTKSVAVNAEYFYRLDVSSANPYYDMIGIGVDIETGGHVFQLILSNTQGMTERTFINETAGNFFGGDIHFGFNITRTFQLKR